MIFAEVPDANGQITSYPAQPIGDPSGLGFSLDSITSALKSVAVGAVGAVSSVGKAACQAVPLATQASQFAPTKYQSTIAQGQSVASSICSQFGPKPAAAAPAPTAPIKPFIAKPMAVAPTAAAAPAMPVSKYPTGSIARFNVTRGVWVVYAPAAAAFPAGLGYAYTMGDPCLGGDCSGLGQEVDPPPPPGTIKVGEEAAAPAGVTQGGQEKDKKPLYKQPLFWGAIGLGVLALGTGAYVIFRRKPAPAGM